MNKPRLRRSPIAFTAKRDLPRGRQMSIGVAQSDRCGAKLHPRTSKVRERKLPQRLLGPRILRSKSKFCREEFRDAFRISSGSAADRSRFQGHRTRTRARLRERWVDENCGSSRVPDVPSKKTPRRESRLLLKRERGGRLTQCTAFMHPNDRDNWFRATQNVGSYERRCAHCPRREHLGHHYGWRSRHPTLPVDERESEASGPAGW